MSAWTPEVRERLVFRLDEGRYIPCDPDDIRAALERISELEAENERLQGAQMDAYRMATERAEAAESERDALFARVKVLEEALAGLLRQEWYTYEGNLEASGHASVDDLEFARAALNPGKGDGT